MIDCLVELLYTFWILTVLLAIVVFGWLLVGVAICLPIVAFMWVVRCFA